MNQIEKLLAVAQVYCLRSKLSQARVSTIVFNDGKRLKRLEEGSDIGTRTFERAMRWFSANWLEGADWPEGVHRPVTQAHADPVQKEPMA